MADIILSIGAATTDVKCVEVAARFLLAAAAIYQSSAGVVTFARPATYLRTIVWLVRKCLYDLEFTE